MSEIPDRTRLPAEAAGKPAPPPVAVPLVLLKRTVAAFLKDDVIHWGAALAYYSLVSLAPLVVLAMNVFGRIGEGGEAQQWILNQVRALGGPTAVELVGPVLTEAARSQMGSGGTILTITLLLFGATAVFANLQGVLNRIWGVRDESPLIENVLRTRLAAFLMVLCLGGILIVSAVVSTVVAWLDPLLDPLGTALPLVRLAELVTSLLLLWLFVAATFAILPDVDIYWRDVWVGSLVTAGVLSLGKYGLSAFLARNAFASLYGTAGSVLLGLMWIFFSCQAFFLGAEFTQVWAHHRGRLILPEEHAVKTSSP